GVDHRIVRERLIEIAAGPALEILILRLRAKLRVFLKRYVLRRGKLLEGGDRARGFACELRCEALHRTRGALALTDQPEVVLADFGLERGLEKIGVGRTGGGGQAPAHDKQGQHHRKAFHSARFAASEGVTMPGKQTPARCGITSELPSYRLPGVRS